MSMLEPPDMPGWMRQKNKEIGRLQRRGLPQRLSATGMQVTDWNDAVNAGFYWSEGSALNNPVGNIAVGRVLVKPTGVNPRVFQEVYFPSSTDRARKVTYRRVLAIDTGIWSGWSVSGDDTGWVSSGVFASASGWTVNSQSARIKDGMVIIRYLEATRATAINGVGGDIANSTICTITDSRFVPQQNMGGLSAAASGRLLAATASATGSIVVTAVAAGLTDNTGVVPAGSTWSISGYYLLD